MANSSEKRLLEEARACDDCLCWLQHCEAVCCGYFTFALTPRSDVVFTASEVRIRATLSPDAARYYELHGARIEPGDIVVVPRAACEVSPTLLAVNMTCTELTDDLRCGIHETDQPEVCSSFVWETAFDGEHNVPKTCLFEYKRRALEAEE
jgi:hypothetical protein